MIGTIVTSAICLFKLFADGDVYDHTVPVKHHRLLSCRPQTTYRTAFAGSRQRVATAPVSRAKALLFARQGQALRIHKVIVFMERLRNKNKNGSVFSLLTYLFMLFLSLKARQKRKLNTLGREGGGGY